jgi:crotonobetainyl-CoA:carnitine CoA-transferase CaiB-like acyl-CoA transferase
MTDASVPEGAVGPLHGIRILDLSSVVMGPFATQMLGDMGADVITVETVEGGNNRRMGDGPHVELSGIALNLLRNKRSISLDLKQAAGLEAVLRIAATCDALVTNLRPRPLQRLGLSYERVAQVRPDIVYCQAQGFRSDTTRSDDPAYDDIIQTESGVADASLRAGNGPVLAPTIMADKICGLTIANAVMAGLLSRASTGRGQRIEVPMVDVMRSFMLVEHGNGGIAVPGAGEVGWCRALSPERGPQQTTNGWVHIFPVSPEMYEALFTAGNRSDLIKPRTRKDVQREATFLYQELKKIVAEKTTEFWLDFCKTHHIPVGQVRSLDDLVASLPTSMHPHAGTYRVIPPPVWFGSTPASVRVPAPRLGQDGPAILREADYSEESIAALVRTKVMKVPE